MKFPFLNRIRLACKADIRLLTEMMGQKIHLNYYPALEVVEFKNAKVKFDDRKAL
jgi:hypothetical protein